MRIIYLYFFFFLFSLTSVADEDYMYFMVDSINLKTDLSEGKVLYGETVASKIYVMLDENEFEILGSPDSPITAETYLTPKRLYFVKDEIKFSTTLEPTNILYGIESLEADDAEIELSSREILIEGKMLEALMQDTSFLIQNISMKCLTSEFTTDVDIACLKNVSIKPFESEFGFLRISDFALGTYEIEMKTDDLYIKDEELYIAAKELLGSVEGGQISFFDGYLKCYKDPTILDLDIQKIVNGCLELSHLSANRVSFKRSALDFTVSKGDVILNDSGLSIMAEKGVFNNGDGNTLVEKIEFNCGRLDIDINNPNPFAIMNGCLKRSHLFIERFINESESYKNLEEGLLDINDFKKFKLEVNDSNFKIKTKVKVVGRVSVKIEGNALLDQASKELKLTITRASIAGIPARPLALYIIESFLDNDMIIIDGNTITIKL